MSQAVLNFAFQMQKEMDNNSHKTEWWELTPKRCLYRLRQEIEEVTRAVEQNKSAEKVTSECADAANFLMFLSNNYEQKEKTK